MGLYDKGNKINLKFPEFNFDFDWKKTKYPVLGAAAVAVFLLIIFLIFTLVQPQPLDASLNPNPLDLSKDIDSYLTVTVNNVTDATASNVTVSVETSDEGSISIFPRERVIATLGKSERRTLSPFVISPTPSKEVYSGTYILTVKTTINDRSFSKDVVLDLKA